MCALLPRPPYVFAIILFHVMLAMYDNVSDPQIKPLSQKIPPESRINILAIIILIYWVSAGPIRGAGVSRKLSSGELYLLPAALGTPFVKKI